MANICPEKIIKAAPPPEVITLLSSSNTANLQRIVFDVRDPVILRLLVCKEEKFKHGNSNCLYPEHKIDTSDRIVCCDTDKKLAHIYIRHENLNEVARSCVIVFIEGMYLHKTDELLEILKNTVDWLDIAQERPYFYIIRFREPVPDNKINQIREELTEKMKKIYKGYSDDEDTCIVLPALYDSKALMVEHLKEHNRKFLIKVS